MGAHMVDYALQTLGVINQLGNAGLLFIGSLEFGTDAQCVFQRARL